jgi:hypothetical protein
MLAYIVTDLPSTRISARSPGDAVTTFNALTIDGRPARAIRCSCSQWRGRQPADRRGSARAEIRARRRDQP